MEDVLATVPVLRRRFTVDEVERMAEAGIFGPEERVELIDGELISMSPIGHRHAFCVAALSNLLVKAAGGRAFSWPQNPVRLFSDTLSQPDLVLLEPPATRYAGRHPGAADVMLLIEVAETSYRDDRDVKLRSTRAPAYARSRRPAPRPDESLVPAPLEVS